MEAAKRGRDRSRLKRGEEAILESVKEANDQESVEPSEVMSEDSGKEKEASDGENREVAPTTRGRGRKRKAAEASIESAESSVEEKSKSEEEFTNPIIKDEPEGDTSLTQTDPASQTEADEAGQEMSEHEPEADEATESADKGTDEKAPTMMDSSMSLPPKQVLGKGKRARIPNKRYSDIMLSPVHRKIENGAEKVESESEEVLLGFESDMTAVTTKTRVSSPFPRKNKTTDLSNPLYLKPFDLGWRRELVWRATFDSNTNRRNGDIYYYTPQGKKVRSMREVAEHIKGRELTLENFTFTKDVLGLNDPQKEIVRDAKYKSSLGSTQPVKKVANKIRSPPQVRSPKVSSPKVGSGTPKHTGDSDGGGKKTGKVFKIKAPGKTKPERKTASSGGGGKVEKDQKELDGEMDIAAITTAAKTPLGKRSGRAAGNKEKACQPCSMRCPGGAFGAVPTLQCRLCLCLYHHECAGWSPQLNASFVCKNCQPEEAQTAAAEAQPEAAQQLRTAAAQPDKLLVGALTTWLPHTARIVEGEAAAAEAAAAGDAPRPQYLEYLAGRKFLVIPKRNVMSVSSPASAAQGGGGALGAAAGAPPGGAHHLSGTEETRLSGENAQNLYESPKNKRKPVSRQNNVSQVEKREDTRQMDNYLQNVSYGYNTLLYVFQYLKVQDLLRAGCVCTMWRDIANHPVFWRTVRMKNSQVHSFEGLANTLKRHGTRHLDLRKMLLPGGDEIWPEFSKAIEKVDSLRVIELCRCPSSVLESLAQTNPFLEVINAVTIKCESMSLDPLAGLRCIRELRIKSTGGLSLKSDINALKELTTLKVLSLTSIRDLNKMNLEVIAELNGLESLDLGECSDFPKDFGEKILSKLTKLEKLRLEKGQGSCYTFEILEAVKDMSKLEQLELVNFDIKQGFDKALGACSNIKKLLIIPTYISQSATTNHMVLGGVLRLQRTLSHFVWGVTLELLRVTELFVDQCEEPEKKEKKERKPTGNGDSIPVLKPVPLALDKEEVEIMPAHDPPQVEILPLPNLQKLLLQSLPTTRVKILKIPFHATWRQSITDSVN